MAIIDDSLRAGLTGGGDDFTVTLDPAFQGLPGAAHGGSVLALFDALGDADGAREIVGLYRRRVPLGAPLGLAVTRSRDGITCRVTDADGTTLVDGGVRSAAAAAAAPAAPAADATPLPVSRTCFACGIDNPLGLRARLGFDASAVSGTWTPRPGFVGADGRLATAALTTLLDEAAFWLGALASGESGMTTELRVTLHGAAGAGPVLVRGERAAVRPREADPRYWQTAVTATDARGVTVAHAAITFVAMRGAARRLVGGLLALNPPEVLRRIFPAYTP